MQTRNVITFVAIIAMIIGMIFCGKAIAQQEFFKKPFSTHVGLKYVPEVIIVKFKPGVSGKAIGDWNQGHGCSVLSTSKFAGFKKLKIAKQKTVEEMVEIYKRNPNVEYAEPNFIAHASLAPNDTYYPLQWHLDNDDYGGINMESAWEITTGDCDVIVAVIDTGVAYEDYDEFVDNPGRGKDYWITYQQAPDLYSTTFKAGYDFVNNDEHPNDDEGHGTHVTGTIAQSTNNDLGAAGVAFSTSIMPVKVLDSSGSGTYTDIADGIYFAANNGAKIINMSLGGSSGSITLENAVAYAYGKGVSIICSSGNDGLATIVSYPAAYDDYCIAVGATRYDEEVAYYSNRGPSLDLVAPGGDMNVDQNDDGYADGVLQQTFGDNPTDWGYWFYQGTSMAAPHVSGVAALLIANTLVTTPDEIREVLQATAEDKGASGWDSEYGWGVVDAFAALNYISEPNSPPVADASGPYTGNEDAAVIFDGSYSFDSDDDPLTYKWDFGDGSTGAGLAPTHTYIAGGGYTVTLVVNDGKVNSTPDTTTAYISEINDSPVADAGPEQTVSVGETVTFDGSGSYDIDDGIVAYSWEFGDGATGSGETTTHTYTDAGIYQVTLTVTDAGDLTTTDIKTVNVTEEPTLVMHVEKVEMELSTRTAGRNKFTKALATVTIVDASYKPVVGVTVHGSWSSATSDIDSGITDVTGKVTLESDEVKNASVGTTFEFTVDDVVGADWIYNYTDSISNLIEVP